MRDGGLLLERQQAQQNHGQGRILIGGQPQLCAALQAQAVEQLGFVGWQGLRQRSNLRQIRIGVAEIGHRLNHGHALEHQSHLFQRRRCAQALLAQPVAQGDEPSSIAIGQRFNEMEDMPALDAAQHLPHTRLLQPPRSEGNGLIGQ